MQQAMVESVAAAGSAPKNAVRHELQRVRNAKTFKFTVAGTRGYFIVGE
jgi:hypothetical protein